MWIHGGEYVGPRSPQTPRNMKAEAIAAAHSQRVDTEAEAYFQAETRKAEARFATMLVYLLSSRSIAQ